MVNIIPGTGGDDHLRGTPGADEFDLDAGGNDTAKGLGGDDVFFMGPEMTPSDHLFGGKGFDTVELQGQNLSAMLLTGDNLNSIEQLSLFGAVDYNIVLDDSAVAAGKTLTIDTTTGAAGHNAIIDATTESNGKFILQGGAGGDYFTSGAGNDQLFGGDGIDFLSAGLGTDVVNGGNGMDTISFIGTGALTAADRIDGGNVDTQNFLNLAGDYSAGLTFNAHTIVNITSIHLGPGHDYALNIGKATFETNYTFVIDGRSLGASDKMHIDGSGAKTYHGYSFIGGAGADVFTGSGFSDYFFGGLGTDTMNGGAGQDVYTFDMVPESTGPGYDTIVGFDAHQDFFQLGFTDSPGLISGFDGTVVHGKLSTANFDANLEAAIGSGKLAADHAVLFNPSTGTLKDTLFLIVDGNGKAGYQAGHDLVVAFDSAKHLDDFGTINFGTPG